MVGERLEVKTRGVGLYDMTDSIDRAITQSGVRDGIVLLFVRHTSASLLIQEGSDPQVLDDLLGFFSRLVREGEEWYTHTAEGPDDMPSHIRSALLRTSEVIPVSNGRMALGTWQRVFLFEHRRSPKRRHVDLKILSG